MALPLAGDTPLHIEAEVIATLRALAPARKLELARDMNRMADRLAVAGLQHRRPAAGPQELGYRLALQRLTPEQYEHGAILLQGLPLMPTPVDPLALALRVGATLDAHAIPYVIVDSVAAVVHGEYRTTRGIDVVLNCSARDVSTLGDALREDFTFLPSDITDALLRIPEARADASQRAGFCAYDRATGFQIDVYRGDGGGKLEVWYIDVRDRLPRITVPLRSPHPDVVFDLQATFTTLYARARYADDIDYTRPVPPPPLRQADAAWLRQQVAAWQAQRAAG